MPLIFCNFVSCLIFSPSGTRQPVFMSKQIFKVKREQVFTLSEEELSLLFNALVLNKNILLDVRSFEPSINDNAHYTDIINKIDSLRDKFFTHLYF